MPSYSADARAIDSVAGSAFAIIAASAYASAAASAAVSMLRFQR